MDSVRLLGSYGGQVLMLVNSLLVCSLAMDTEFDRVALHDCVASEISFDPYDDDRGRGFLSVLRFRVLCCLL